MSTVASRIIPQLVAGLTALAVDARQARWNVTGDYAADAIDLLDRIVDNANDYAEIAASRMADLGLPLDGRITALANVTLPPLPAGFRTADQAQAETLAQVQALLTLAQGWADELRTDDPASARIVSAIITGLANDRWWLFGRVVARVAAY